VRWLRARRVTEGETLIEHDHPHPVEEPHAFEPAEDLQRELVGAGRIGRGGASAAHVHRHLHVGRAPDDPFVNYGRATALGVGMIHGIGAETPTQVLIFLTAAGAGGKGTGVLLLICFLMGLLTSNSLLALASTFGYLGATRNFRIYAM